MSASCSIVVVVQVDRVDARFLRIFPGAGLNDVAYRREVHPLGMREIRVQVSVGNAPGADEADFHGIGHDSPWSSTGGKNNRLSETGCGHLIARFRGQA